MLIETGAKVQFTVCCDL